MNVNKYLIITVKNILIFIAVIAIGIVFRIFVFEIYYIPSASMENTLFEGDIVLVNKLHYGAKIPFSNKRTYAFSDINRNDVFVFKEESNSIFTNGKIYIKRCIGIPGDLIEIKDKHICINKTVESTLHIKNQNKNHHSISSTFHEFDENYFNENNRTRIIPYKGYSMTIDSINMEPYRKTIYRDQKIETPQSLINQEYHFKHNFYFMMGDHRNASLDSRSFGPICEHQIIGKAVRILFSWDKRKKGFIKVRFNRILKKIQ